METKEKTEIQRKIENIVTNGLGFEPIRGDMERALSNGLKQDYDTASLCNHLGIMYEKTNGLDLKKTVFPYSRSHEEYMKSMKV